MMLTLYYFKLYKILWVFIGVSITLGIVVESYFVHVSVPFPHFSCNNSLDASSKS